MPAPDFLKTAVTQQGRNLDELSRESPLLIVFLRHAGCPFCRETLADLTAKRKEIDATGSQIVLVHMMSDVEAVGLFKKYELDDVYRISDPEQQLYRAFDVSRGTVGQVMGPAVWWRGFKTTFLLGNLPGKPVGDIYQLPGAFLVIDGKIIRSYEYKNSADRPDYVELVTCPLSSNDTVQRE